MKRKISFLLVALVVSIALLGGSFTSGQPVLGDEPGQPTPVYPTKVPPPPGEEVPQPESKGVTYKFTGSDVQPLTNFEVYGFAENPWKWGTSAIGRSWQWAEYGGDPWEVDQMETYTYLWWWDANQEKWILEDDAYSFCDNTYRCEADASAAGVTGYWIVSARWKGEAYSGDSPPNWDLTGESEYIWLSF